MLKYLKKIPVVISLSFNTIYIGLYGLYATLFCHCRNLYRMRRMKKIHEDRRFLCYDSKLLESTMYRKYCDRLEESRKNIKIAVRFIPEQFKVIFQYIIS